MSESKFYSETKNGLDKCAAQVELDRVENNISSGFSDVFYSIRNDLNNHGRFGLIEMKFMKRWPVKPTTIITLEHFTPEQKSFLFKHGKITQRGCFMYLKADTDYLLFDYTTVYKIGTMTKAEMITTALHHFSSTVDYNYLADLLTFN